MKSSRERESLAMDPDVIARIGLRRYRLIKLWVSDVNGAFDRVLGTYITEESLLLDAGCSRGDPDLPSLERAQRVIGCDMDWPGLRANEIADDRVAAPLDALPFRSGTFDVIVCKFVVEHLAAPLRVFQEFFRVLKPGGVVALLTPNRNSPFAWTAALIPFRVKQCVKRYLFGGHDEDTFPAWYRANTPGRLSALMKQAGFRLEGFEMLAGMWAFFIFNSAIARLVRAIESVQLRIPGLRNCSTHMLGVWRKPVPVECV
jgi:SAM-dependent methyltransferase